MNRCPSLAPDAWIVAGVLVGLGCFVCAWGPGVPADVRLHDDGDSLQDLPCTSMDMRTGCRIVTSRGVQGEGAVTDGERRGGTRGSTRLGRDI